MVFIVKQILLISIVSTGNCKFCRIEEVENRYLRNDAFVRQIKELTSVGQAFQENPTETKGKSFIKDGMLKNSWRQNQLRK